MTERGYNPDDPSFLASRRLDEELPADEQARLDAAMLESADLREQERHFRAVDELVKRWGAVAPEVDSEPFIKSVVEAATSQDESDELSRVDGLLADWAGGDLDIDSDAFVRGVMTRVAPQRRRLGPQWIIRLGVPLAAAAAVMFAVTATLHRGTGETNSGPDVVWDEPGAGTVVVAFARTVDDVPVRDMDGGEIEFISVGAEPVVWQIDEAPPS